MIPNIVEGRRVYRCDPSKNIACSKDCCFEHGGPCSETFKEECKMEHEIRYYLRQIKALMAEPTEDENRIAFKPSYLITAVKLPTGAIELSINTENIEAKIDYILEAYDDGMCLKTNSSIVMQNIMIV